MSTTPVTMRCKRCGTPIRNRDVCPSCGNDTFINVQSQDTGQEDAGFEPASEDTGPQEATLTVGAAQQKAICPMCMCSVSAAELVDYQNEMICAECAKNMTAKTSRKGGESGGVAP